SKKYNCLVPPPANALYTLASYSSCGCLARMLSSLIATCSPLAMLVPMPIRDPTKFFLSYPSKCHQKNQLQSSSQVDTDLLFEYLWSCLYPPPHFRLLGQSRGQYVKT